MDERDMEEEGKDREGEEWGKGIKKIILFGISWNSYFIMYFGI
jgi:hypothetical protein